MRERKNILVEDHIATNIDSIGWDMETFVSFVKRAIPKKHTFFRTILKLVIVIRTEVGPTGTPKHLKKGIVRHLA
jgi:hypothetical protein